MRVRLLSYRRVKTICWRNGNGEDDEVEIRICVDLSRVDVNTRQKDDLDLDDLANSKKVGSRLVSRR